MHYDTRDQYTPTSRVPRRRRRRRSPLNILFRLVFLFVFVSGSIAVGIAGYWLLRSEPLREATSVAVTGGLSPDRAFAGKDELNILILGRDEDRDTRGQVMDTNGRTDTILVAHFDFRNDRINLLSIPRDTLVRIPGYRGRHKINAANQFGGPELTAQVVEELIGVKTDGHYLVDYPLFERLVDMAGGIPVEVDHKLDYDDNWGNLHIHLEPGYQVLSGEEALGLARFRKSNDGRGSSDMERIARQQRLLASARQQLTNPRVLIKLPNIFTVAMDEANTTLTVGQALSLANFARNVGTTGLRMETLPSTETRTATRIVEPDASELVDELFFSAPREVANPPG